MITMSSTAAQRVGVASKLLLTAAIGLKGWWLAYLTWRLQQKAIDRSQSLSDRQLNDIGLSRSQIERADRCDLERDRVFSRYC